MEQFFLRLFFLIEIEIFIKICKKRQKIRLFYGKMGAIKVERCTKGGVMMLPAHFKEKDLHPFLVKWSSDVWHLACRTIDQSKSKNRNKGENEWVHPDIVGALLKPLEGTTPPFVDTVGAFYQQMHKQVELYSFELKLSVTLGTLKQSYFQAVSNSSWANYGYLVTSDLNIFDEVLMDELSRLVQAFGIGVILLKPHALAQTEVLFEARYRENLDFHTMDKMANKIQNSDFKNFLQGVNSCLLSQNNAVAVSSILTNPIHFDPVLEDDNLKERCLPEGVEVKIESLVTEEAVSPATESSFIPTLSVQAPSVFQSIRSYSPEDYTHSRPLMIKVKGAIYPFTTWKDYLKAVCLLIREMDPMRFQQHCYVTDDFSVTLFYRDEAHRWMAGKIKKSHQIELDEDLYIVEQANAKAIVSLIHELIEIFHLPDEWVKIALAD